MHTTILIVEDDKYLNAFLEEVLQENGYHTVSAFQGTQALQMLENTRPDLVILDLGLPDIDGETVCQRIKKDNPRLPVIILTASDQPQSMANSFERGADDYIAKPFANDELLARVKARLRKQRLDNPILKAADVNLNTHTLEVKRGDQTIELTQTEFKLLHYLMVNTNRVLSREQILNHVWAQDPDIETRVVDVYIGYLRKKVDKPFPVKLIHSKRGFGYVIKTPE